MDRIHAGFAGGFYVPSQYCSQAAQGKRFAGGGSAVVDSDQPRICRCLVGPLRRARCETARGRLGTAEHRELIRLTDQLEAREAKRLQALVRLAKPRKQSLPDLVKALGLRGEREAPTEWRQSVADKRVQARARGITHARFAEHNCGDIRF